MEEQQTGECPLCDTGAVYRFTDHDNYRMYRCPNCGIYEVSVGAERKIRKMSPEKRLEFSSLSINAPEGMMLEIRYDINADANDVVCKYVPRRSAVHQEPHEQRASGPDC